MQGRGDWYAPLREIKSLARTLPGAGSLAGLAAAREMNLAQYFTPADVVAFMWSLVQPAIDAQCVRTGELVTLFDNSVGTGRLFQFADPDKHSLHGVDVHADSVDALSTAASEAGFVIELASRSMESIRPRGYHVALINPPFSIALDSPLLAEYSSNTFGRFGPYTRALSHRYALEQALEAAALVVALLPKTFAAELLQEAESSRRGGRLCACFHLPRGAFREEGTDVETSVLVFGHTRPRAVRVKTLATLDACDISLNVSCQKSDYAKPSLHCVDVDDTAPVITMPVTHDRRVRITRKGALMRLQFHCGLTQAKVMNGLLRCRVVPPEDGHRYPRGVRFVGQGQFDLEVQFAQESPRTSLDRFALNIEALGGLPSWDASLQGYIRKRLKCLPVEQCPLRREIFDESSPSDRAFEARVRQAFSVRPNVWGAPVFQGGTVVTVRSVGDEYLVSHPREVVRFVRDEFRLRFESLDREREQSGWRVIHEGRAKAFPERAAFWRRRAVTLGIHRWLWSYQLEDLIESYMTPGGEVMAWEQGTGKARLAVALALLGEVKHALICVEAFLVDEMERELKGLPLAAAEWQVIRSSSQVRSLRRVNIITYNRLRSAVDSARPKFTYAKAMRRRCRVVIADEGDLLANIDTAQSRALHSLAARRRFVLTGTPIGNYPRDTLPLIAFAKGHGTATQPYGYPVRKGLERPFITRELLHDMTHCVRGIDRFRESFVVTEWVTNLFNDSMQQGAKREVPKIANLPAFRDLLSRHVKRRLTVEPDVSREICIPQPTFLDHTIEWDAEHLRYYLDVSQDFAAWYRESQRKAGNSGKAINLVALLARIQAVQSAANNPQKGVKGFGRFAPLTSKQRALVERACALAKDGKRTVMFMDNPNAVEVIANALRQKGIDPVVMHGERPIAERTEEMNRRFRDGDCPTIVATYGVTAKGLNLWQASVALLGNRCWTAAQEAQAARRLCRPQQTLPVTVERFHLRGSIDDYQAQMVAFKQDATDAGLDFATPTLSETEFLHLDTLLGRFCEELDELVVRLKQPSLRLVCGQSA